MVGRIIACVSMLLCAVPFLIIYKYNREDVEPIGFWSGDTSLKGKVKDVKAYNQEMAALYGRCGQVFLLSGVVFLFLPEAGIAFLIFDCTLGIYIVYRCYKNILKKYS